MQNELIENPNEVESQKDNLQNDENVELEEEKKITDNLKISSMPLTPATADKQKTPEKPEEEEEFTVKIIRRKDPPIMPKAQPVPEVKIIEPEPVIINNDKDLETDEEKYSANPFVSIKFIIYSIEYLDL